MASGAESSSSSMVPAQQNHQPVTPNKKSIQTAAGPSYPEADAVVEVSAATLLSTDRYVCDVCFKGFLRVQNLIFHQRVHNLHFSLKSTSPAVTRRVYLCPEPTCPHHNRANALGDFGGLRKHYLRKHSTEKKHKCEACTRGYAAKVDLKAHIKVCGKKRYICHCGAGFSRRYNFDVHQEACVAQEHEGAAKHSPTPHTGDSSLKTTSNNNNSSSLIGLNGSHLSPHSFAFQTPSVYYSSLAPYQQSQLYPSGTDNGSFTTDLSMALNLGNKIPDYSFPSPTQQNQHELQEGSKFGLYADLLMSRVSLDFVDREIASFAGDGGNINGNGNVSNLRSSGGGTLNLSSSVALTPDVHNASLNEMLNPVSGVGCSTFNQQFSASYDQGGHYGHGDGGGNFDYGGGMEAVNFETSAATATVVASYEQHLNQLQGYWF